MSEMEVQRRRLFDDLSVPTRPRRTETQSAEYRAPRKFDTARSSSAAYFVRSPSKRGVRVSARFKRMTASPTKFLSPCRKGIKGLRIAAPSPLAGPSPSQNVTFEKSPNLGPRCALIKLLFALHFLLRKVIIICSNYRFTIRFHFTPTNIKYPQKKEHYRGDLPLQEVLRGRQRARFLLPRRYRSGGQVGRYHLLLLRKVIIMCLNCRYLRIFLNLRILI
jgi:hypothetical protein